MNGRFYAGQKIECEYFDGTDYTKFTQENPEEEEKRLESFAEWLENVDESELPPPPTEELVEE